MIHRGIIREGCLKLFFVLMLIATGFTMVVYSWSASVFLTVLGIIIAGIGLWLTYKISLQLFFSTHPLLDVLANAPRQVVWVYSVVTQRMPFGFQFSKNGTIYFKLADGDELSVSLPARQLKTVSKALNKILPQATFGYSEANAQYYDIDPEMLRREKDSGKKE